MIFKDWCNGEGKEWNSVVYSETYLMSVQRLATLPSSPEGLGCSPYFRLVAYLRLPSLLRVG